MKRGDVLQYIFIQIGKRLNSKSSYNDMEMITSRANINPDLLIWARKTVGRFGYRETCKKNVTTSDWKFDRHQRDAHSFGIFLSCLVLLFLSSACYKLDGDHQSKIVSKIL